jgi:hypothetical protein
MRWVARLLIDAGQSGAAAQLLGAIAQPGTGRGGVYGDDTEHVAAMRRELIELLGTEGFENEAARGAKLDDAAATELVMTAFDAIAARAE